MKKASVKGQRLKNQMLLLNGDLDKNLFTHGEDEDINIGNEIKLRL